MKSSTLLSSGDDSQNSSDSLIKSQVAPRQMRFPFPGGVQFTWDGRVLLHVGALNPGRANTQTENGRLASQFGLNAGWGLTVFRPEVLETTTSSSPFLEPGVFSASNPQDMYPLEYSYPFDPAVIASVGARPFLDIVRRTTNMDLHNSSALLPDPSYTQNPFPSDDRGNPMPGGQFETYKFVLITNRWVDANKIPVDARTPGDEWVAGVGLRSGLIVVRSPRTASATVHLARMDAAEVDGRDGRFRPLRNSAGQFIFQENEFAIEPTATADGRLIIYQAANGVLKYTFNPVLSDTGWSAPRNVTDMFYDARVRSRYPIAQSPFVRADGRVYGPGETYKGSYPWISPDGTELFHTASYTKNLPSGFIQRGATTVIGKLTGWVAKHIDGTVNPDRDAFRPDGAGGLATQRVFFYSFGGIPGMWSPYTNTALKKIPLMTSTGPMYPIISNQMGEYHEVTFEDHVDGEYLAFYRMNELVIPPPEGDFSSSYVSNRTPDTSGHFNTATLFGDAIFPADIAPGNPAVDVNNGINGRAIYFGRSGFVTATPPAGRPSSLLFSGSGLTLQLWLKRMPDSARIDRAQSLVCFDCSPSLQNYQLLLETNGSVRLKAKLGSTIQDSGPTGTLIPNDNQWHHIAGVIDATSGRLTIFIDGNQALQRQVPAGGISATQNSLVIGPAGQPGEAPGQGVGIFIIDEVAVSGVARSQSEIRLAAYQKEAAATFGQALTLPMGLKAHDLKLPVGPLPSISEVELGKMLFHESRLSSNGRVSCATCHNPQTGFTDGLSRSVGVSGRALSRNTPTVINRAFSTLQFFDGRSQTLEAQATEPIAHPDEMGNFLGGAIAYLQSEPAYVSRFQAVYGAGPSVLGVQKALASFQRKLLSGNSRVDQYEAGQLGALTASQINGRNLFHGKAKCIACHLGSNFSDEKFHRTGLAENSDTGRMAATLRQKDFKAFKTPTLRDVSKTAPYMHDGSVSSLKQVVALYNQGALNVDDRDLLITPLGLTSQEEDDLVNFMMALDGDPSFIDTSRPQLPGGGGVIPSSLSVSPCQVAQGQTTCTVTISSSGIPTSGVRVRLSSDAVTSSVLRCSANQNCQVAFAPGLYTATLQSDANSASSSALRTVAFEVRAAAPVVTTSGSITTAAGCAIAPGTSTCVVQIVSSAQNAIDPGVRVRASGTAISSSILICGVGSCSIPSPYVGTFILTLHTNASDANSAILDTKTIVVTQGVANNPSGSITNATGCTISGAGASCNVNISATAQNAPQAGIRARLSGSTLAESLLVCSAPSCAIPTNLAGTFILTLHAVGTDFNSPVLASASVVVNMQVVTIPTGSITTASGCTIAPGASTCNVQVTSSAQNAVNPGVRVRASGAAIASSIFICGAGSCSIPSPHVGTFILTLHSNANDVNSAILDTKTIVVTQGVANNPSGSITTASGCTIAPGASTCNVQVSSTAQNAVNPGVRVRASGTAIASSIFMCGVGSCSIPSPYVGTFILTLHSNANDVNSAILDTKTIVVTQAPAATNAFAPVGAVERIDAAALSGWAGDQDSPASVPQIAVILDNNPTPRYVGPANGARGDAYNGHGFFIANPISTLGIGSGAHNLKVYIEDLNSQGAVAGPPRLLWELNFTLP
jgi:cytochrome c peroxidase